MVELDPIENMKVQDDAVLFKDIQSVRAATTRRDEHPLRKREDFQRLYEEYQRKLRLGEELEETRVAFEKAMRPLVYEELRARKGLLVRLQYSDNTIKVMIISIMASGGQMCHITSGPGLGLDILHRWTSERS